MRSRMIVLYLSALAFVLAGCVPVGEVPQAMVSPPQIESRPPNVMLYRRPAFFLDGKPLFVTIDGKDVAKIKVGERLELGLGQGSHAVGLRCASTEGAFVREWRLAEFAIEIADETEQRFVELGPCTFVERSKEEARRDAASFELITPGEGWKVDLGRLWPGGNKGDKADE